MANTTWSATDKASITLSGTNSLVATGAGVGGVRAIDLRATGKCYWEVTANTIVNGNTAVGVATKSATLSTVATTPALAAVLYKSGNIWVNNVAAGTGSPITTGAIVCIALDADAGLIWFRLGAAGNWNNAAVNNPATSLGGVSLGAIALPSRTALYPLAATGASGDAWTANFGDTAFTGAVPSGFASGFVAGAAVPPLYAATTLEALEQWVQVPFVNTQGQLTQIALEHWTSVAFRTGQAIATQITMEEWGSVATTSSVTQIRAMVLA